MDPREALVRRVWDRWNAGDPEPRDDEMHPDIELHSQIGRLTGVPYRGHDGLRQWAADIEEQFETWQITVEATEDAPGGALVVLGSIHLKARTSGVEFDQPFAWITYFEDARIRRWLSFTSHDEARAVAAVKG